jgi:WD40 repeat protein
MTRRYSVVLLTSALLLTPSTRAASGPKTPSAPPRVVARTDASGDALPPAALSRLGSLRFYHGGRAQALAFLRDGKTLLSAGDGVLRAWNTTTGKEVPLPFSAPRSLTGFTLSPNGRLLATISEDGILRVFDLKTGLIARQWSLPAGHGNALAFSADNALVAWVDATSKIHLHDLTTDRDLRTLAGHEHAPQSVAFSADGKKLASVAWREGIFLWDLVTGKRLRRYAAITDRANLWASNGVFFSADRRCLLATANDGAIVCYDADYVEERYRIETSLAQANSLALSPDGKTFATGSSDGTVRLWQVATGKAVSVLPPGPSATSAGNLAFSPDGKSLAVCMDSRIRLWDLVAGKELHQRPTIATFATAGFSLDGQEVIALHAGALLRASVRTGKIVQQFKLTGGSILGAALSPDRKLVAVARDDMPVCVLDVERGTERARMPFTYRREAALALTPEAQHLVGLGSEETNTIRIWTSLTGKDVATLKSEGRDTLFALAMSRDGRTLYTVGQEDKQLFRWEVASGQRRGKFQLPDPKPVIRHSGGRVVMWGGARFGNAGASRLPIALSADNRLLAVCRGEFLFVCNLRKERVLHALIGPNQPFSAVAFSRDGRLLAAGADDHLVRVWDLRTGKLSATLSGHRAGILQVDFSAAGDRLLSTSSDGTLLVWDVAEALRLPALAEKPEVPRPLEALWADLASEDAAVAEKALLALEDRPAQTVALLTRTLRPVLPVEPERLTRLIAELDSNEQSVRDHASAQLKEIGEQGLPALRKASESSSLEVRKRALQLLNHLDRAVVTGLSARPVRAVEVLERVGTAEARKLVRELAGGTAQARLTQEAQKALKRMRRIP